MKMGNWKIFLIALASSLGSGIASEYEFEMKGVLNRPTFVSDSHDSNVDISNDFGAGFGGGINRVLPVHDKVSILIGIGGSNSNYIRNTRRELTRRYSVPYDTTSPAWRIDKHTFDVKSFNVQTSIRYDLGVSGLSLAFGHIVGYVRSAHQAEKRSLEGEIIEGFVPIGIGWDLACYCGDITEDLTRYSHSGFIELAREIGIRQIVLYPSISYLFGYSDLLDSGGSASNRVRELRLGVSIGYERGN